MNHKELIEKAAKAAGLRVTGRASTYIVQGVSDWALIYDNDKGGSGVFDPLTNDSDILLLARKCELAIDYKFKVVSQQGKFRFWWTDDGTEAECICLAAIASKGL